MSLSPVRNAVLCVAAECGRVRRRKKILFWYTAITGGYALRIVAFALRLEGWNFVRQLDVVIVRVT